MPLTRQETFSNPGASTTVSWNTDPSITPFQLSIAAIVTGSVSYKLQYTYEANPNAADAACDWIDSATIPAGTTSTKEQQFTFPITRIRLVFASGTGSVKLIMLQGMSIN